MERNLKLKQQNCSRVSKDSEKALGLDLNIKGHLKEGSSRQCGRRVLSQEMGIVCTEPSLFCKFGVEGELKNLKLWLVKQENEGFGGNLLGFGGSSHDILSR